MASAAQRGHRLKLPRKGMNVDDVRLAESEYEAALRSVFPTLYHTALELSKDEAEAAWAAQWAFVEAWSSMAHADLEPDATRAH